MAAKYAVSLMALLGSVAAQGYSNSSSIASIASTTSDVFNGTTPFAPGSATRTSGVSLSSGAAGNSTTRATGSLTRSASASRTSSGASSTTSGAPISTPSSIITINGVLFLIEIDISYQGITIDFAILVKRAGETFDQCLTTCAANSNCAGTSFTDSECTFYSSINANSQQVADGTTFATVISRANAGTGAGTNGTNPSPGTPSNVTAESLICPAYQGAVLTSSVDITFAISCGRFLIGTTFDAISTIQTKRQAIQAGLPQTISNCVDLCSVAEGCVGVTFQVSTETCSYYSDVTGSTILDGYDSAVRVQDNSGDGSGEVVTTTVINGQVTTTTVFAAGQTTTAYVAAGTTATVYTTIISTVTVLAGGDGLPLPSGATVTYISSVGEVVYTNTVPAVNMAFPTVTITTGGAGGAAATVTVYVDQNGNPIGGSGSGSGAAGAGAAGAVYPTVTVHDVSTVSVCPTTTDSVVWTTVYVR
ncbi:hypothetical protein E4T39_06764 [Aureobasidium subglaciale]|nr:hypothetical protein E4T39_06764 [Aureobasidium subglaciale]